MSKKATISVLQKFKVDEVTAGSDGPFVALTLYLPGKKVSGPARNIDIGIPQEMASELGKNLVLLTDRMSKTLQ